MSISQLNNLDSNYGFSNPTGTRNTSGGELGKDEFLKLFVEQLKAQDPLSPMDNNEFIAQNAQFTQLEQMTNLNTNITDFLKNQSTVMESLLYSQTSSQALNLVGKEVTAYVPNEAEGFEKIEGKVDKITFNGSSQVLHVGEKTVSLDQIAEVKSSSSQNEVTTNE